MGLIEMNFFKNYKSLFLSMSLLLTFSSVAEAKTSSNDDKYIFYKTYTNIGNLEVKDINNKTIKFSSYKGKVLLIVNVASQCGYTPQYEGLEKTYKKYKSKGFEILGFPCNDFGNQEPSGNQQILKFCKKNYGITFKLFDKVKVLGNKKSPLYNKLINAQSIVNGDVEWNFEKFLISKDGKVVKRFKSSISPESKELTKAIEAELNKK
jgi:glutathione peroxidase